MKSRVIAIGLDAADPDLLARWFAARELPNLARLKARGTACRFENTVNYGGETAPYSSTEGSWVALQTGVKSPMTGYWETIDFDRRNYVATNDPVGGGYDYREFAPFFALGDDYRVAVFDVPVSARVPNVNGLQIVGWGGHFPFVKRGSEPASLLDEITARYGRNEVLYNDYGVFWKPKYLRWLEKTSIESVETRTRICLDLLHRDQWDLLLAVYGESHGASHDLWFASDPTHPLHACRPDAHDPLLNVFRAIDRGVGEIVRHAGPAVNIVCFSAHGMQSNNTDLADFFLLPELMYRYNFPGRIGFAAGDPNRPPPAPHEKGRHWYWFGDIWRQRHAKTALGRLIRSALPGWLVWPPGEDFEFPYRLDWFGPPAGWMPAQWYRKAWPRMRSFALPAFADGHIRLNVIGREGQGRVDPCEYDAECERITEFLLGVTDARTGKRVVDRVIRTREDAHDPDPRLPHGDLIVIWHRAPFDVIDGPGVGRIGPVPYYRTGGHKNTGFLIAAGPDVAQGHTLDNAEVVDFAPTILDLLGAPIPAHYEGRSLVPALAGQVGRRRASNQVTA
jgi:predicted AlkP superfamily phosphohydrolase/phosphomutase